MWTTVTRKKNEPIIDVIARVYQYMDVIDIAEVDGVYYAAMRGIRTGYKFTSAFVFLVMENSPTELQIEHLHESMGPFQDLCPKHILDQLDPIKIAEAISWRNRCRANNITGEVKQSKKPKKLESGCQIRFAEPIEFANDMVIDTFTYAKIGKASRFAIPGNDKVIFEIPGWRKMKYEVI